MNKTPKRYYKPILPTMSLDGVNHPVAIAMYMGHAEIIEWPFLCAYREYIRRHHPDFASSMLPAAAAMVASEYVTWGDELTQSKEYVYACLDSEELRSGMPNELVRLLTAMTQARYEEYRLVKKAAKNPRGKYMRELMLLLAKKAGLTDETQSRPGKKRTADCSSGNGWLPIREISLDRDTRASMNTRYMPAYAGIQPMPSRAAIGILGYKCFKRRQKYNKVAVLIDLSGSMYDFVQECASLALGDPKYDVVVYASDPKYGNVARLVVNGTMPGKLKTATIGDYVRNLVYRLGGENEADGNAIRWFADQYPGVRKYWVSDLEVFPPGYSREWGQKDCLDVCSRHGIIVRKIDENTKPEQIWRTIK
jgi:hypothetical protein